MYQYHFPEDHSEITEDVAASAALLENATPEVYATFLSFQESLMKPYTSPSGKMIDGMYEKMLPVAAQLATASAILAASESRNQAVE